MIRIERVRVFADERGRHGNALAIVADGSRHDNASARRIADDRCERDGLHRRCGCRSDSPLRPAGAGCFRRAPLEGTAWYLRRSGVDEAHQLTDAGPVDVTADVRGATISSAAGRGVPRVTMRLEDPAEVAAADASGQAQHDDVWAWIDEHAGSARARACA